MTIEYYTKNVYGVDKIYLADEHQKRAVQLLTGNKTLTREAYKGLKMLGYTLEEVLEPKGIPMSNMRDLDNLMGW